MLQAILAASLLLSPPAPAQDFGEEPDGDKLVKVSLLADRDAIRPGDTFALLVHYKIEPRWHIYWENPGEAGQVTRANVTAPTGYEIKQPVFPWPQRHEQAGPIVTYIHEDELVVFVDVVVPKDAVAGSEVTFDVEGKWLVCTEVCVSGSGKAAITLPIRAAGSETKRANEKLVDAWRAKTPKPWSELQRVRLGWTGDQAAPKLAALVPGAKELEFFPARNSNLVLKQRALEVGKNGATLNMGFEFEPEKPGEEARVRGVLWVKTAQGEASYRLDEPFAAMPK